MDDLSESRSHFGVCTTGHHIYVAGGETTERFNLLTKIWTTLNGNLPAKNCSGITIEVAAKRYIYGFGQQAYTVDTGSEIILRLDTFRL